MILLASLLLAVAPARADADGAAAARGRRIYREGIAPDGRTVGAISGTAGLALPPAFAACVHCHGDDGRGKTEAGRFVPDIRGETLDVPYVSTLPDGRHRSPYNGTRFYTALTEGLDPSGHPLDATMPRYRLSEREAADLLAYLKTIGLRSDEGVTDDIIRVGLIIPIDPAQAESAHSDRQVIAACFDEMNQAGGIHRRKIELADVDTKAASSPPVLVLLTDELTAATPVPAQVPLLCITAEDRRDTAGDGQKVFSLFPGTAERKQALVNYAKAHDLGAPVVIPADVSDNTLKVWRDAGVKAVLLSSLAASTSPLSDFGARARALGWEPGQLWLERPATTVIDAKAFVVEPVVLSMLSADAQADYLRWAALRGLPVSDLKRQFTLVSSARLLGEALKGAGRELSREKLVTALEGIRSFQPGLMSPLSFSERRHTATNGVYVVPLSTGATTPAPEWVPVD